MSIARGSGVLFGALALGALLTAGAEARPRQQRSNQPGNQNQSQTDRSYDAQSKPTPAVDRDQSDADRARDAVRPADRVNDNQRDRNNDRNARDNDRKDADRKDADRKDKDADRKDKDADRKDTDRTDADRRDTDRKETVRNDRAADRTHAKVERKLDRDFGALIRNGDNDRLRFSDVNRNSVAYRAGVRDNDVIVSIGGNRVTTGDAFERYLFRRGYNRLPIIILRDGREQTIYVDTSTFYTDNRSGNPWLGVELNPRYGNEAVISLVQRESPASRAGLRPGDRIFRFAGDRVDSADHLVQLVSRSQPGQEVQLEVSAGRENRMVNVMVGERPGDYRD